MTMGGGVATQVRFAVVDGELEVSAPSTLEPLDDFLESEIGTDDATLDLIDHHVRHDREWQFSGNACQLRLDGERVTVTHNYTDVSVDLSRDDLRGLLAALRLAIGRDPV
jgi:uncharacterized protein YacL (UPF0231 family)